MPDPVVSVVIPLWDPYEGDLGRTLSSVAEQTFLGVEAVVAIRQVHFDGNIKAEIDRRHDVRHVVADPDVRSGGNYSAGARAARGRFLTFLRPGSTFDPRRTEWAIDAIGSAESGCVTCGARTRSQPAFDVSTGDLSSPFDFLKGLRDAATLFVSRDLLEAAGGFDPGFNDLPDLDLAVRLALRFAVRHISNVGLKRERAPEPPSSHPAEFERIVRSVVEHFEKDGPQSQLAALGRITRGLSVEVRKPLLAFARQPLSALNERELCIGVIQEEAQPIAENLGVPKAHAITLSYPDSNLEALAELEGKCDSTSLVLVDPYSPLDAGTFSDQLLRGAAEQLGATLPFPEFYVHRYAGERSMIPGTVFKKAALKQLRVASMKSEGQFWAAFSRSHSVGGTRAPEPVARPVQAADTSLATRRPKDLLTSLIDSAWYSHVNPDVAVSRIDPVEHFLSVGWQQRRRPNPWFHTDWYVAKYRDAGQQNLNPLEHFVKDGAAAGYRPCPSFDIGWYSKHYLASDRPCAESLLHFLTEGLSIGAVPYPPSDFPEELLPDGKPSPRTRAVAASPARGDEDEFVSDLIDAAWYSARYGPLTSDPADHYVEEGWREGLNPNAWFDTRWYLSQNPDVDGIHPLLHFVRTGARNGRRPHPLFDVEWYTERYLGAGEPGAEALRHFLSVGLTSCSVPSARLATPAVTRKLLKTPLEDRTALIVRLQNLVSQAEASGEVPANIDPDLWPLLLLEDVPASASPVLILCESSRQSFALSLASASVLPLQEFAIFGVIENECSLRITHRHGADGFSVRFRVPEQDRMLAGAFEVLGCRRAAAVEARLVETASARMVRRAGLPVAANGRRDSR
jgi:hypothetical protein